MLLEVRTESGPECWRFLRLGVRWTMLGASCLRGKGSGLGKATQPRGGEESGALLLLGCRLLSELLSGATVAWKAGAQGQSAALACGLFPSSLARLWKDSAPSVTLMVWQEGCGWPCPCSAAGLLGAVASRAGQARGSAEDGAGYKLCNPGKGSLILCFTLLGRTSVT